ncbi:MAG: carbamoyl-phosphate synthase (glutamine-hydrolyzing) large subunit [Patescibacteria group bacterium]|nr:carbamoyl-phosphate synthase (glutamine-hydrolyzing) large subunit [Patescibacteria group bacterium]
MNQIQKVLLLGSGAIKIGEAGEFDYSGSQAIKALKEEGMTVILANPNIATIQTSKNMADDVYFVPITLEAITDVIRRERPDGILLSFGGQSALNCGIALHKAGVLERYNVQILGTPIEAIIATEDRLEFAKRLNNLGILCAKGDVATTVDRAVEIAQDIGFPVMVRSGFALGGAGSGIAPTKQELIDLATKALVRSPQIIVEESLKGWKEIEYEVVRDMDDNCITVCNMENFDPVGIHTGESIVVAPSQTLTNHEYYALRQKSIDVIRDLKIIGECNIQFALNPKNGEIRVIEVNARLSRSSALASKATGYPLAYVAAKLSIGKRLHELPNKVTQKTTAFFEPALDYIVVKMPRWDLDKFDNVESSIGSEMKSVGEVMSIGRSFSEAAQKAARMLNDGYLGLIDKRFFSDSKEMLLEQVKTPTSLRIFTICSALYAGASIEEIYERTHIDRWFLSELQELVDVYKTIMSQGYPMSQDLLRKAKSCGFSDEQIASTVGVEETEIRKLRKQYGIEPYVHVIDTTAGEFPAVTNYCYTTYNGRISDIGCRMSDQENKKSVIVLGCGPYAIGTSVEFDWSAVSAVRTLRDQGYNAIVMNCNPETVSTDFDISDRLYFEELTYERVMDVYEREQSPMIVSVGGQIANNLAPRLAAAGVPIIGTNPANIRNAEDRRQFSKLLDHLGIHQPEWDECHSDHQAIETAKKIGYPLIIRPSFVLSGKSMSILYTDEELRSYLDYYKDLASSYNLVMSKFYAHAKECDVDGVADQGEMITFTISEHVEEAGVHSGDSTLVFPPYSLSSSIQEKIQDHTSRIVQELSLHGAFNIQYLIVDDTPYVIECNARASRSFPFVSKAMDENFIELATKVIIGLPYTHEMVKHPSYFCVKAAQFSYHKLRGADPLPKVEMTSTGEVAAFGETVEEAFLKAILATGVRYPEEKAVFVSFGGEEGKHNCLSLAQQLAQNGFQLYATSGTSAFLQQHGIEVYRVGKIYEGIHPTVEDLFRDQAISFAIVISERSKGFSPTRDMVSDGYIMRRMSIDRGIPLFTNRAKADLFIRAILRYANESLPYYPWSFYTKQL